MDSLTSFSTSAFCLSKHRVASLWLLGCPFPPIQMQILGNMIVMVTNGSWKMQTWSGEFLLQLDPVCVDVFVALLCLALGIEEEIVLVAFSVLRLGLNGLVDQILTFNGCHGSWVVILSFD